MTSAIGLILLTIGFLGAATMLFLALKSARSVYTIKCQKCGCVTKIPQKPGEYLCQSCGIPLAKITDKHYKTK